MVYKGFFICYNIAKVGNSKNLRIGESILVFYILFFAVSVLSVLGLILTKAYKSDKPVIEKFLKVAVIVWMCLCFVNLFLPDKFAMRTYDDRTLYEGGEHIWFILLRWFNEVAIVVLPAPGGEIINVLFISYPLYMYLKIP